MSTGSSSARTSSRSTQAGSVLRPSTRPVSMRRRHVGRRVERVDGAQHGAAEYFEAFAAHARAARGTAFAGGLHEHGGHAARVERALFADAQRKREMRELAERARRAGVAADVLA